jgi:hypothetical protein
MLPGGSGISRLIVALLGGQGATAFPPASRVSISELFGIAMIPRRLPCPGVYPDFLLEPVAKAVPLNL